MNARIEWSALEVMPSRASVFALQGLPPDRPVPSRIDALLDTAMAIYFEVAVPRAIVADITADAFAPIYRGEGLNEDDTPLPAIYRKADRLALAAATVGAGISERISTLFDRRDVALGYMLDAVGSAAADHVADLIAARYVSLAGHTDDGNWRALTYSPGYCGWHVTGQRALFRFLRPEQIGITLNASCLMQPMKSVSGIIVAGAAAIHRFRPVYPVCVRCAHKQCRNRIAALGPRGGRHRNDRSDR